MSAVGVGVVEVSLLSGDTWVPLGPPVLGRLKTRVELDRGRVGTSSKLKRLLDTQWSGWRPGSLIPSLTPSQRVLGGGTHYSGIDPVLRPTDEIGD